MTSRSRTYLRYITSILLTTGFLYFAFRGTNFSNVYASMKGANYWWILVTFGFLVASHVVRAWRWRYLLEPIKPDIGMRNL
ncbi:MAG: lysylphosphatidylglycerol synthase domain-containing protein, partial [Bacteroidota bacterium]